MDEKIVILTEIIKENGCLTVGFHDEGNVSALLGFDREFDLYSEQGINWYHVPKNPDELSLIRDWIKRSKTLNGCLIRKKIRGS